jgi:hypothetical protein
MYIVLLDLYAVPASIPICVHIYYLHCLDLQGEQT